MTINYDIEKLNSITKSLYELTGIAIAILDTEYNYLANSGNNDDYCSFLQALYKDEKPCFHCDNEILFKCKNSKKLEYHICHAGLCDLAMPIIKDGYIVSYVIMGRIRSQKSPKEQKYSLGEKEKLTSLYNERPLFADSQIKALCDLMPNILFENAIKIKDDDIFEQMIKFINDNLKEEITVKLLCNKFHFSKNSLYKFFSERFQCTVNNYITERRIEKSKSLLSTTKKSVYQIAEESGINNYTYFCKLFKKATGFTPTDYRKRA